MAVQNKELIFSAPLYPDSVFFAMSGSVMRPWQFNGWRPESLSWKSSAYIHSGLSGYGPLVFTGPDAERFLNGICTNSFARFPIGSMKHGVMCTEGGLIASHGIIQRMGEEEFRLFASGPWAAYQASVSKLDVKVTSRQDYLFQVAGPKSLQILEKVTGESLRDIDFLRFRESRIGDKVVEIGRIGMAGSLAYEIHGPLSESEEIYDAVYQAGREFGIERLGWRTYFVNHVEGGFPQQIWTFHSAQDEDAGYRAFFERAGVPLNIFIDPSGSVDPANMRARYRTPREVNWTKELKFDHDFVGRAAVEAEAANRKRKTVTLRWNPDDVVDIFASLVRPEDPYKQFDLPAGPHIRSLLAHADHVVKGGREIGYSSGNVYSLYYRDFISMCVIDVDQAEIGNEVIVRWGDFGGRIKDVRATVERFPYFDEGRNNAVDVAKLG